MQELAVGRIFQSAVIATPREPRGGLVIDDRGDHPLPAASMYRLGLAGRLVRSSGAVVALESDADGVGVREAKLVVAAEEEKVEARAAELLRR